MSEMNIPEPQSRKEYFLRKIAYPDAPCPEAETREEQYLEAIAQNKGGESGLPDYSAANDGDVLAISSGSPAWTAPSGGGGGVFVVNLNVQTGTLDKTWQEIHDAMGDNAVFVVTETAGGVMDGYTSTPVVAAINNSEDYMVLVISMTSGGLGTQMALTDSADGYPVVQS